MLWLDHDRRIRQIGRYIRYQIFKNTPGSFEEATERFDHPWITTALSFMFPTVIVFAGPAIVALSWSWVKRVEERHPVLWWVAAAVTAIYVVSLIIVLTVNIIKGHRGGDDAA